MLHAVVVGLQWAVGDAHDAGLAAGVWNNG